MPRRELVHRLLPTEVPPPLGPRKYWTPRGIAEWLVERLSEEPPRQSQDRHIRVFISSTFRDMQAERDQLMKFIFPQLGKLCESRGVTWG